MVWLSIVLSCHTFLTVVCNTLWLVWFADYAKSSRKDPKHDCCPWKHWSQSKCTQQWWARKLQQPQPVIGNSQQWESSYQHLCKTSVKFAPAAFVTMHFIKSSCQVWQGRSNSVFGCRSTSVYTAVCMCGKCLQCVINVELSTRMVKCVFLDASHTLWVIAS